MPSCALCQRGEYQPDYNATGCLPCPVASFCPGSGSTSPTPCPGGTYSSAIGLKNELSCTSVVAGQWAPTGSQFPEACPASGFTCPGRSADKDNTVPGSKPIIVADGQASVDVVVEKATFNLTIAIEPDAFDEAAIIAELALSLIHI